MEKYDVIIAGASFAGLAVASKITNSNVLLIDRNEIGTHQASACGTTVKAVKEAGCEKSILKTFDIATLHVENKETDIHLPEQFCTIDYKKFCKLLARQNTAEFLKANVKGVKNSTVVTSEGNFKLGIAVDCTGRQAVLASSQKKNYVNKRMLSFGIETEIPYKDDKLRFFVNPDIIENGPAWLFPCKNTARFGVASYSGNTKIVPNLKKFVESYNLKIGKIHGGYFCYCLKKPVVKNVFVVGCAAGQTLPLTGEGIRRSVYFGLRCGEIIQKILDKRISLKRGQREYKELALKCSKYYGYLLKVQNRFATLPNWKIATIARVLTIKPIASWAWKRYEAI
jgi:flavin-dependent dehydrogenase